ncbi:MAG: FmdB family zinc ribbon protein [Longimicrobiales bacterium]
MPTYEYRCANGHHFEQFQRMTEPPVEKCPECGAPAERLLSAGAGLLFKGSGFYITDYRSDSYKKAAQADSGGGSGEGTKPASSDEKKKSDDSGASSTKSGSDTKKSSNAGDSGSS